MARAKVYSEFTAQEIDGEVKRIIDAAYKVAKDIITGNAGNNVVWAGSGNDTLTGGAGNDNLNGEAGDDWLNGGLGNDTLNGGGDKDHLVFDAMGTANADHVTNFASAWDDIR